jgi:hypothetical protein
MTVGDEVHLELGVEVPRAPILGGVASNLAAGFPHHRKRLVGDDGHRPLAYNTKCELADSPVLEASDAGMFARGSAPVQGGPPDEPQNRGSHQHRVL